MGQRSNVKGVGITVGSLFAGIGGIELGLERAGMKVVWQVEKDDYCRKVLAKHWPDVERFTDVREVGAENLEPVDLICGGFPCQPVSSQGHKRGQNDERWLWPEFARVVGELRPRWVLLENTPGLLARGMGQVLGDLSERGYDAEWQTLSPCYVGSPQHRGRVFILAYPDSIRLRPIQRQPLVFHQEERSCWWEGEPSRGRRSRTWRQDGERLLRPPEPDVDRVADGVPARVDRLRALGNAVVPQVAEWIGRRIVEHAEEAA